MKTQGSTSKLAMDMLIMVSSKHIT